MTHYSLIEKGIDLVIAFKAMVDWELKVVPSPKGKLIAITTAMISSENANSSYLPDD
ncbi:MAG: hypothetical protein ABR909_02990 [Candidatus Bathyarchaeia archaeon]|jgi:DNA-binding HxlR family transcriptional regulator